MSEKQPQTRRTITSLTSIRFFAALSVVLFHSMNYFSWKIPLSITEVVASGWRGVTLFFVLSGFILAYNYCEKDFKDKKVLKSFALGRFARIYPIYFVALIFSLPQLFILKESYSVGYWVLFIASKLTLLNGWHDHTIFKPAWLVPGWTLCAEFFFYAMFPFIVSFFKRLSVRSLLIIAIAMAATYSVPTLIFQNLFPDYVKEYINAFDRVPLLRLWDFAIGVAAGLIYVKSGLTEKLASGLAIAGIVGAVVTGFIFTNSVDLTGRTLFVASCTLTILGLAESKLSVFKPLGLKTFELLGNSSYAMYLFHVPIFGYMAALKIINRGHSIPVQIGVFIASMALIIGVSIFIHIKIEEPARKWIRKRVSGY